MGDGIGKPNSKISKNQRGWNITSEKTEHLNGGGSIPTPQNKQADEQLYESVSSNIFKKLLSIASVQNDNDNQVPEPLILLGSK